MLDVMLLHGRPLNVKITDRSIRHDFNITDDQVEYIVLYEGIPVTQSPAELLELKENEHGHVRSIIIRTPLYDYEVVHYKNQAYHGYRSKRI